MEKLYEISFMKYTSLTREEVKKNNNDYIKLVVGKDKFIVPESKIDVYRQYGDGIRSMVFIGYLADDDAIVDETPTTNNTDSTTDTTDSTESGTNDNTSSTDTEGNDSGDTDSTDSGSESTSDDSESTEDNEASSETTPDETTV